MKCKSKVEEVLQLFQNGETNYHKIERQTGVAYPTLYRWIKTFERTGEFPISADYKPDLPDGTTWCIDCKAPVATEDFYLKTHGKPYPYCYKCANNRKVIAQQLIKQKAVNVLGGICEICSYNKYVGALQFHHLDPKKKDFSISAAKNSSMERLLPEIMKCVLVCANCHFEIHHGLHDEWLIERIKLVPISQTSPTALT